MCATFILWTVSCLEQNESKPAAVNQDFFILLHAVSVPCMLSQYHACCLSTMHAVSVPCMLSQYHGVTISHTHWNLST